MSTKLIETADLSKLHQIGEFGLNELAAMKEAIAKKLSIPQFNLFMYQMNRMGLDPSLGHGVPILYGTDVNIRVEYEGLKYLGQKSEGFKGIYTQAICENDEFEAESNDEGIITKVHFKMNKPPRGKVVGSFAVAKREGFQDLIVVCDATEFDKYAKKNSTFWKLDNGTYDPDMAKKHAGTRAVKGHFNIATVVEETMAEANGAGQDPYVRKDITEEINAAKQEQSEPVKPAKTKAAEASKAIDVETTPVDEAAERKAVNASIKAKLKELGIVTDDAIGAYMTANMKVSGDKPTVDERKTLLVFIEKQIADKGDDLPD